jgi:hypothetical protein
MTVESDGVLRVESRRAAAHALIGIAGATPAGQSVVDEFLAERRHEADTEQAKHAASKTVTSAG